MDLCIQRVAEDRHCVAFGEDIGVGGGFNSGWTYVDTRAELVDLLSRLRLDGCCAVLGEVSDDEMRRSTPQRVVE